MFFRKPILILSAIVCPFSFITRVAAATYHLGSGIVTTPLNAVLRQPIAANNPCAKTWYDPELFTLPNGNLEMVAQGGNYEQNCPTPNIDAFLGATRIPPSAHYVGGWSLPTSTACPMLTGGYARCAYSPSSAGPVSSPSVVKVGSTYYMAFSGGNGDYIAGKV